MAGGKITESHSARVLPRFAAPQVRFAAPRPKKLFVRQSLDVFLHLQIWAGCRISLSGYEPSVPPFSSNKSEIPLSIEIQPSLGCIALYHLKGNPLQKPFTFGQKKHAQKALFTKFPKVGMFFIALNNYCCTEEYFDLQLTQIFWGGSTRCKTAKIMWTKYLK